MTVIPREELERRLQHKIVAAGIDPEAFFVHIGKALEATPDPVRALTNLSRFLEAGFSTSLIREFHAHPVLLSIFLELVGQSQYLADILVRHPEWFHWLTSTGELQRTKTMKDLRSEAHSATVVFDQASKRQDALKRFHRREVLRIGAMDILGEAPMQSVVAQLSTLADLIIDEAVTEAYRAIIPEVPEEERPGLCVIGLGKLGGRELNFSSDIDLMFVYGKDEELARPVGRIQTMHELSVRLAETVVGFLSDFSGEGYFYRVDMRLRPDGRSGPLALSRGGFLSYYESRGERWERQMLIKARWVGGDRSVGERFLSDLRPFVYPRTVLSSPWDDIASMKRAIEEEFRGESNIKLGAGGIRDIEFLVQGLQLVHGGVHEDLRSQNTLSAIGSLARRNIIPSKEADDLREAYELFRDIEHRLQLLHGFQTHELPVAQEEFDLLARKLGYPTASFRKRLARHRRRVRASFVQATRGMANEPATDDERALFDLLPAERDRRSVLREAQKYPSPSSIAQRIGALLADGNAGSALRAGLSSKRFRSDILRSIGFSSVVFERMAADPLLVESLVGQAAVLLRGRRHGWADLLQNDTARFKRYNEVRSAIRFLTGRIRVHQFEAELTTVAESVLETICHRVGLTDRLLVVGAGKLGSAEMGISSDLDLLLFFDERTLGSEAAQRMGMECTAAFKTPLKSYDVDVRLRPEGGSAPLVAGLEYLKQYLGTRADTWEVMALKRSRPLWGAQDLRKQYAATLRTIDTGSAVRLVGDVRSMRSRMERERGVEEGIDVKVGAGGIVDIEFISQAGFVLQRRAGGRSTRSALRALQTIGLLRARETHILNESLSYLRTIESILRLNSASATSVVREASQTAELVASFMGLSSGGVMISSIRQRMASVRRLFETVMDRWGMP